MKELLKKAEYQNNPLRYLSDFIEKESKAESADDYARMRFVGYVMDIGYSCAKIITSDPYKKAVGGIPKGSFLLMLPDTLEGLPPHFSLLRVQDVATTPLSTEVQQTYFELHKKAMPELDRWTQQELQWGALNTTILGMYYPDPDDSEKMLFSGDVNAIVSAHRYRVYSPDAILLDIIINGLIRPTNQFDIGVLRMTECKLPFANSAPMNVNVKISVDDFLGFRTAMFGKTRLGKSNVVKLIAKAVLEATRITKNVGQLIFDINGEYANDNPQNRSIRSIDEARCMVYALNPRSDATYAKQLKLNFYEQPESCLDILSSLLAQDKRNSIYIKSISVVKLPSLAEIATIADDEKTRVVRKIYLYWAILAEAGFEVEEAKLSRPGVRVPNRGNFDPHFSSELRAAAYGSADNVPYPPASLHEMKNEMKVIASFRKANPTSSVLKSTGKSKESIFDSDDIALLDFLNPVQGSGPAVIRPFSKYHSANASDFIGEIIESLEKGETVILDLGSANDEIRRYFSDLLSWAVFAKQEEKFVGNRLEQKYTQLYFEEAHNLFPRDSKSFTDVYSRFAKEGAKFHIGMVYSTQSPSTISQELLAQTENFFVGHLSSQDEVKALGRVQIAYDGVGEEILKTKTPGYMRMLSFSHRFIVPVQAHLFS